MQGMIAGGTAGCADFREGGLKVLLHCREAAEGFHSVRSSSGVKAERTIADGLGISSTRDVHGYRTAGSRGTKGRKEDCLPCR
ncbi:MAG: hypothetical protein MZV63_46105 [Marinilabiliales bacterium]|nr:hypothetical protein [Marinilabiliales bacterium]